MMLPSVKFSIRATEAAVSEESMLVAMWYTAVLLAFVPGLAERGMVPTLKGAAGDPAACGNPPIGNGDEMAAVLGPETGENRPTGRPPTGGTFGVPAAVGPAFCFVFRF
jgi:hypothetical protein